MRVRVPAPESLTQNKSYSFLMAYFLVFSLSILALLSVSMSFGPSLSLSLRLCNSYCLCECLGLCLFDCLCLSVSVSVPLYDVRCLEWKRSFALQTTYICETSSLIVTTHVRLIPSDYISLILIQKSNHAYSSFLSHYGWK